MVCTETATIGGRLPSGCFSGSVLGSATICGYWYYVRDGVWKPTRYARVQLWSENTSADVLLAETAVQTDGYYEFPATNIANPLDVYVKLLCQSLQYDIVRVVDNDDVIYWFRSSTYHNVTGGVVNMGSCSVNPNGIMSWVIYDNIVDAYFWLLNQTGWTRSEVYARIETNPTGSYCTGDGMIIHPRDGYDRVVPLHEYAHCVHYEARGGSWPWKGYHPLRYPDSETDPGWALTEGWAEFFQCAVDNNPILTFGTSTYGSLETTIYADGALGHGDYGDWDGNVVEAAVAQVFWDIFDGVNPDDFPLWDEFAYGDYVPNRFDKLWQVFLNDDPNSLSDVWQSWDPKDAAMWAVFRHARIDVTRNIAVTSLNPNGRSVVSGESASINVTVTNLGDTLETFNLSVSVNGTVISLLKNVTLESQSSAALLLDWNTTSFAKGDYTISAEATIHPRDFNVSDDALYGGPITILSPDHDVCVSGIAPSIVFDGTQHSPTIRVKVRNWGIYAEIFNVTLSANATFIGSQMVTLDGGGYTVLTLPWNTSALERGTYVMNACASTIPGEIDTADNTFDHCILLTIAGDVDGDRDVDIFDIVRMAGTYGVEAPDARYDPNCDIDGDGDIDIFDIVGAANHYGECW
jgi:hypothetical protein